MALITIPAHHTSNSYGTLAQAESYFSAYDRVAYDDTWNLLSDSQKEYALIIAAKLLNTFNFRGKPVTRQQSLAFPRFTNYQVVNESKDSLATFYDIEYTKFIDEEELDVSDNKFIDISTSADGFYNSLYYKDIQLNQIIKAVRSGTEYLTIVDMDGDGEWIQVKEDIEAESDLTTTLYYSDIFGYPTDVMTAQFELSFQVVNTKIFQATVGENAEKPIASFYIAGAMHVKYTNEMFKLNKFENSSALDIVYYLLGNWMAGVKGVAV